MCQSDGGERISMCLICYTAVFLPASLSLQVCVLFNVHLSEGVSPINFKYHMFDVSLDATRLISSFHLQ